MPPALPPDSVHPRTRDAWRRWLEQHHDTSRGVWLISFKKATGMPRVEYDIAVEDALCFGWVDSKPRKLDDERTMLWFSPRKVGSGWSGPNKSRVARAIADGLMTAAGLARIAQAKRDGSWSKLDAIETLALPADLTAALAAHPPAEANFSTFPRSAKRGILEWISTAKTDGTRAKRITETATLAARNERANQWRKPTA